MGAYADTSYLVSLYTIDSHTAAAAAHDAQAVDSPLLTGFGRCELQNAVRLKVFRQEITVAQADASLLSLEQDIVAGSLVLTPCDWDAVFAEAETLSERFTAQAGHRGMDVLHVAAAIHLGADAFLTFDARQATLAKQAGLTVGP